MSAGSAATLDSRLTGHPRGSCSGAGQARRDRRRRAKGRLWQDNDNSWGRLGARGSGADTPRDRRRCRHAGPVRLAGVDEPNGLAAGASVREAAVRPPAFPGIQLVTPGGRRRFLEAFAAAAAYRGPTLIDTPAGASPGVVRPLGRADRALLVTTTTPACLEDTRSTRTLARRTDTLAKTLVCEGSRGSDRRSGVPGRPSRSDSGSDWVPARVLAQVPTVARRSRVRRSGWVGRPSRPRSLRGMESSRARTIFPVSETPI